MGTFVLCEGCRRHVRRADRACPFCGATARVEAPRALFGRASRAGRAFANVLVGAVAVPAVACSGASSAPPSPTPDAAVSAAAAEPTVTASASAAPSEAPVASADPPTEPPRRVVAIYGASIQILTYIAFDQNSAVLLPASARVLDEVAMALKDHPELKSIDVEGHADKGETNPLGLSKARSAVVIAQLVKLGVDKARLVEKAYGDQRPSADSSTPEGRIRNRATTFYLASTGD